MFYPFDTIRESRSIHNLLVRVLAGPVAQASSGSGHPRLGYIAFDSGFWPDGQEEDGDESRGMSICHTVSASSSSKGEL